jgi:ATP:ADP antiporter, AAA family
MAGVTWGGQVVATRRRLPAREVLAPAAVLFAIMVAHTLLETARDALFLAKLGPGALAFVYLVMAAIALLAFVVLGRFMRVRDPRRSLFVFLFLATVGTGVLAATVALEPRLVFVLYIWTGLVATMVVPSFWLLLDRSLQVGDAKRRFAAVGAGGILGAMVGAGAASVLGHWLLPRDLVAAATIAYGLAAVCAMALAPHLTEVKAVRVELDLPGEPQQKSRYIHLLVALGVASTIALTLGDLVFKRALGERLPASELATAFGAIYAGLNAIGLVVQVVITPRLLARWGVGGALMVLPVIVAASGVGFALTGAMVAIIALKLGDGGLRYSLHRVGTEILYMPVPAEVRDREKPIADAIGLRGGQAAAALLVFGMAALGSNARAMAAVAAAISIVWWVGVIIARRAYVDAFRGTLKGAEIQRDVLLPDPDAGSVELLIDALASPDEGEALAALDVLSWRGRVPALVLYHPSALVVRRALASLAGSPRPDVVRVLRHLLDHPDPRVRAAALAASSRTGSHRDRLVAALKDPEPEVRAVALVGLAGDAECAQESAAGIAALMAGSTDDRSALAQAVAYSPDERFRSLLHGLLGHREPAVLRHVLQLYQRVPELIDLERCLALLADPHVRGDARRACVAAGQPALERLIAALDDPRTSLGVRRQLPRTIARFRTPQAATALVTRLLREPDGTTEFKILRGLGRLRTNNPALEIDASMVHEYAHRAIADAARYATLTDLAGGAEPSPGASLIARLLDEKRWAAVERAFRALGVIDPRAELRSVHDALVSPDEARRNAGREIIEAMVPAELRLPLLATLDTDDPDERRRVLGSLAPGPFESYEAFVGALLADQSESVRCVAAYHVAERRMVGLRKDLVRLRPLDGVPLVMSAFDQAIARLDV